MSSTGMSNVLSAPPFVPTGEIACFKQRNSVVFPLPVAPTSSWNAPSDTRQSSGPIDAAASGYEKENPRASTAG